MPPLPADEMLLVQTEVDEIIAEFHGPGPVNPERLAAMAEHMAATMDSYDQDPEFGARVVAELRQRAKDLRRGF